MYDCKTLLVRLDEKKVLHVTLDAPDTGNALDDAMLDELLAVLHAVRLPDVRAVVLSGAGDDFCRGADRDEMRETLGSDPSGAGTTALIDKARRVCEALETLPVPTIARLHGRVIGAGLVLAVNCDLRIAADTTSFWMPELMVRLVPAWAGGLGRLIELAGEAAIVELLLTGTEFSALTARKLNLVQRVEVVQEIDRAITEKWLTPVLRRKPQAVALTKRLIVANRRTRAGAGTSLLDAYLLTEQLRGISGQGSD
ncbi:enoyl-CoA hydratase/isomerase family protein [Streptomyces sp. PLK6-54]|uniref:Enoyl-CoA hydratase/isomerase family protein n=2 Tax=Actinacidiphila acidipaludis TaxID=2873382 RepID=A0ABS7QEM9_9ACTN|nr:enoyl-CoA hydratase/isomerase family protein [Streptomyces acidipaludis]